VTVVRRSQVGRSVDRLINFSDAVVAVAITVLVLPLIDIPGPQGDENVWDVIAANGAQFWTFLFTFYVVAIMWATHNRILRTLAGLDGALMWLNTTWLAAIVLLPWASAMYGEADAGRTSVGVVYWFLLGAISGLGGLMASYLRRHPDLLDEPRNDTDWRTRVRGPAFAALFVVIGLASTVFPYGASWLALGAIPLTIWLRAHGEDESQPAAETTRAGEDTA
jgi:uncharacterized membrane protein